MDRNLLAGGLGLIVLLVAVVIGAAMIDKSIQISDNITDGQGTVTTAVTGNVQTSFTTFTGLLPLAVLALVGGVAILYFVRFASGASGGL